jgi:hypothetical protein
MRYRLLEPMADIICESCGHLTLVPLNPLDEEDIIAQLKPLLLKKGWAIKSDLTAICDLCSVDAAREAMMAMAEKEDSQK